MDSIIPDRTEFHEVISSILDDEPNMGHKSVITRMRKLKQHWNINEKRVRKTVIAIKKLRESRADNQNSVAEAEEGGESSNDKSEARKVGEPSPDEGNQNQDISPCKSYLDAGDQLQETGEEGLSSQRNQKNFVADSDSGYKQGTLLEENQNISINQSETKRNSGNQDVLIQKVDDFSANGIVRNSVDAINGDATENQDIMPKDAESQISNENQDSAEVSESQTDAWKQSALSSKHVTSAKDENNTATESDSYEMNGFSEESDPLYNADHRNAESKVSQEKAAADFVESAETDSIESEEEQGVVLNTNKEIDNADSGSPKVPKIEMNQTIDSTKLQKDLTQAQNEVRASDSNHEPLVKEANHDLPKRVKSSVDEMNVVFPATYAHSSGCSQVADEIFTSREALTKQAKTPPSAGVEMYNDSRVSTKTKKRSSRSLRDREAEVDTLCRCALM